MTFEAFFTKIITENKPSRCTSGKQTLTKTYLLPEKGFGIDIILHRDPFGGSYYTFTWIDIKNGKDQHYTVDMDICYNNHTLNTLFMNASIDSIEFLPKVLQTKIEEYYTS